MQFSLTEGNSSRKNRHYTASGEAQALQPQLARSIEINSTTVMITIKTITNMASLGVSQLGGSGDQCLGLRDQMGCRFVLRNHGVYSCPRR